jgi:hypothetical protein
MGKETHDDDDDRAVVLILHTKEFIVIASRV